MAHMRAAAASTPGEVPEIPVFDVGQDFPVETVRLVGRERGHAMLDAATAGIPNIALRTADAVSRCWLKARHSPISARSTKSPPSAGAQVLTSSMSITNGDARPRPSRRQTPRPRASCACSTGT